MSRGGEGGCSLPPGSELSFVSVGLSPLSDVHASQGVGLHGKDTPRIFLEKDFYPPPLMWRTQV